MENLTNQAQPGDDDKPGENSALHFAPFEEVALLREPGPYARFLDLTPGIFTSPHPEFMVKLVTDSVSHKAYIRRQLGNQYKNFENFVRGKNQPSAVTLKLLMTATGLPLDELEKLGGSAPDGPLCEAFLWLFRACEGIPSNIAKSLLGISIVCPCCGHNFLNDASHWWTEHGAGIRPTEYLFAERLLNALMVAAYLQYLADSAAKAGPSPIEILLGLSNPTRHPIGNWIAEVQASRSLPSLSMLAEDLFVRKSPDEAAIPYSRLKKWSSGQDVMPPSAGWIIKGVREAEGAIDISLVKARALALITEFLEASLPESSGDNQLLARSIVHNRLKQIDAKFRVLRRYVVQQLEKKFVQVL